MATSSRRELLIKSGIIVSTGLASVAGWRMISQSALSSGMGIAYKPWKEWNSEELERLSAAYAKYKPKESLLNHNASIETKVLDVFWST